MPADAQAQSRPAEDAAAKTGDTAESGASACGSLAVMQPWTGLYARKQYWDSLGKRDRALHILRSLQQKHPQWVFCGPSAALVHGLPLAYAEMETVHIAMAGNARTSTAHVRRHTLEVNPVTLVGGLRATPLIRTAFDCARTMDFKHGLAVTDAVIRRLSWSPTQPAESFAAISGRWPFRQIALRAARHANALSESPGESMARAAMIEQGFSLPELQVEIPRPLEPGRVFRVDFLWHIDEKRAVIGEFDGKIKYEDERLLKGTNAARVLADEQHREAQLSLMETPILRLSFADVMNSSRFVAILQGYGIPRRNVARATLHWDPRGELHARFSNVLLPWSAPHKRGQ